MKNNYVIRRGQRQKSYLTMINTYPKEHGIHFFLVVEGESDERFFNKLLDHSVCKAISICDERSNKEEVIRFIDKKNKDKLKGFLGIVDADFDHILGRTDLPENIIMTDFHDMEMVILKSQPDLRSIYSEIADPLLIKKYEAESGKFIDSVINVAYEIGILRLACSRRPPNSRPVTKDLEYLSAIDRDFSINMQELETKIVKGSGGKCQFEKDLEDWMNFEKKQNHDKYQVCCGHDVTEILVRCFSSEEDSFGYGCTKLLTSSKIESLLRVAYIPESFTHTDMYHKILEWEENNGIKILDQNVISTKTIF